jgi:hypothetical protein
MKSFSAILVPLLGMSTATLVASSASAASITIENPSFELPATNSLTQNGDIQDWIANFTSGSPQVGVFNPSAYSTTTGFVFFNNSNAVPDGTQVAYRSFQGSIAQVLSATLEPDVIYELSVFVGNSLTSTFFQDRPYNIQIGVAAPGYIPLAELAPDEIPIPPDGEFIEVKLRYSTDNKNVYLGQPLAISVIKNLGPGDVFFDNVSLRTVPTTPIPTPALLPGLIGMGVAALRKRKQEVEAEA